MSGEYAFSTRTRVGFSDTDAQGIVYYGRYNPYFDLARVEYLRSLGLSPPGGRRRVRDARERRRVLRAGPLRRRARDPRPRREHRADEHDLRVRGVQGAGGDAARHGAPDARLHRPRERAGRSPSPTRTGRRSMSTPDADEQLRAGRRRARRPGRLHLGRDLLRRGRRARARARGGRRRIRSGARPSPCVWRDTRVAELAVDGEVAAAELEAVAAGIADLCLVGWDTGGEVWQS